VKSIFAGAILLLAASAHAVVIYDFAGECAAASDCSGTARGVLTLADTYTPETALSSADFLSFTYASSQGTFAIPSDLAFLEMWGVLPSTSGRAVEWVNIDFSGNNSGLNSCAQSGSIQRGAASIDCLTDGWWYLEFAPVGIGDDGADFNDRDHGTTHTWTLRAVPEPSTAVMAILAFAGVGWSARRSAR